MGEVFYTVEPVAQSHEENREDLTNEEVLTTPITAGPFDTFSKAADAAFDDEVIISSNE